MVLWLCTWVLILFTMLSKSLTLVWINSVFFTAWYLWIVSTGVFRTQSNIYNGAFFQNSEDLWIVKTCFYFNYECFGIIETYLCHCQYVQVSRFALLKLAIIFFIPQKNFEMHNSKYPCSEEPILLFGLHVASFIQQKIHSCMMHVGFLESMCESTFEGNSFLKGEK